MSAPVSCPLSILTLLALTAADFQDPAQKASTVPVMRAPQTVGLPLAPKARFIDVPGVAVTYYDVSGHDVGEIHRSLAKLAPRDPRTKQPIPAISSWSVKAAMKSLTAGGHCTITSATLQFHASATMPRLVIDKDVPPKLVGVWNRYAAELEARQAAQLRFAYERLSLVERSLAGIRCDKANAVAEAGLARIKSQQIEAQEHQRKSQPRLTEPDS